MHSRLFDMCKTRKVWRLKLALLVIAGLSVFIFTKTGDNVGSTKKFLLTSQMAEHRMERSTSGHNKTTVTHDLLYKTGKPDKMVIILTYMRSGSSLTGDLIQQDPDVFYVYEPLYTLSKLVRQEVPLTYFNKHDKLNIQKKYDSNALEILESMLTCDSYNLDIQTLRQYHYVGSKTTKNYLSCLKASQGVMGTASCLPLLHNQCAKSKVSAVKIIRLSLKVLRPLMAKLPGLKIVHLIRDPRGTLRSQQTVGEFKIKDVANATVRFCNRVMEDLNASSALNKIFPGRIKTVRYEDIAESPVKVTEDLYKFIGLDMTPTIKKYIWNITSAGLPDNCIICTTRNNSVATAYKWRQKLHFNIATVIDKVCSKVYNRLGYLAVNTEKDQRNMKVPVRKPMKFNP